MFLTAAACEPSHVVQERDRQGKQVKAEWGEQPDSILNHLAVTQHMDPPCPRGWNSDCALAWKKHLEEIGYEKIRADLVNARASRPLPCRPNQQISFDTWPRRKLTDSIDYFARRMRQDGSSDGEWAVIGIEPETVESALQIALQTGELREEDIERFRRLAVSQLFKARARTFVLLHKNPNRKWRLHPNSEPRLLSMHHGAGFLVGMTLSMEHGLQAGKATLVIFEDRTCTDDVSHLVQMRLQAEECGYYKQFLGGSYYDCVWTDNQRKFLFEGKGNLLEVLAKAIGPYAPKQSLREPPGPPDASAQTRLGLSLADVVPLVGLAVEIVKLLRFLP